MSMYNIADGSEVQNRRDSIQELEYQGRIVFAAKDRIR